MIQGICRVLSMIVGISAGFDVVVIILMSRLNTTRLCCCSRGERFSAWIGFITPVPELSIHSSSSRDGDSQNTVMPA